MTARVQSQRFRQRKLSTKQNLPVVREHDIEPLPDDDASRHIPKVETGVEKGEEIEHHLQAVISAAHASSTDGKTCQIYIPTPDAVASELQYDHLYPKVFSQPATYIRYSSTVEETSGCPYCMTSDDVAFLKDFNQKQGNHPHCSEDDFEIIMYFFEDKTQEKQPYADVDNTPVLPYEELEADFDETIGESARRFAKDVYAHWKNQRLLKGNRPLLPSLKFEKNLDTDDADPYVCFRRREVRQVRKTRGRDAQVTEKLKKLRKELEDARAIVAQTKDRELLQRDQLHIDKNIFEQRAAVKDLKRKLSIKGDDEELLITQKPVPKPKRPADLERARQNIPGMKPRDSRSDGRLVDSDLVYLEEQQAKKTEMVDSFVEDNLVKHQKWNIGWVDATWRPITPPTEQAAPKSDFRSVFTQAQLPSTPPTSVSDEAGAAAISLDRMHIHSRSPQIRVASPPKDVPLQDQTRFRRRIGRGGRVWIDRRGIDPRDIQRPKFEKGEVDERVADRYKYDCDSSEDEQIYPVDWTDTMNIRYRNILDRQGEKQQQPQQAVPSQQAAPNQQAAPAQNRRSVENNNRSASGHLMPPTPTNPTAG